jgi:hypothetical protein
LGQILPVRGNRGRRLKLKSWQWNCRRKQILKIVKILDRQRRFMEVEGDEEEEENLISGRIDCPMSRKQAVGTWSPGKHGWRYRCAQPKARVRFPRQNMSISKEDI